MTFQLSRTTSGDIGGGIFTIGEVATEWFAIQDTDELPVLLSDSWSAAIDGFVVDGQQLTTTSGMCVHCATFYLRSLRLIFG